MIGKVKVNGKEGLPLYRGRGLKLLKLTIMYKIFNVSLCIEGED